jgi:hypothetical protein
MHAHRPCRVLYVCPGCEQSGQQESARGQLMITFKVDPFNLKEQTQKGCTVC